MRPAARSACGQPSVSSRRRSAGCRCMVWYIAGRGLRCAGTMVILESDTLQGQAAERVLVDLVVAAESIGVDLLEDRHLIGQHLHRRHGNEWREHLRHDGDVEGGGMGSGGDR